MDKVCSYPIEIMILIIFIDVSHLCPRYLYEPDPQPRQIKPPSFPVSAEHLTVWKWRKLCCKG